MFITFYPCGFNCIDEKQKSRQKSRPKQKKKSLKERSIESKHKLRTNHKKYIEMDLYDNDDEILTIKNLCIINNNNNGNDKKEGKRKG